MAPDSPTHADFPETDPEALERLRRFGGAKLLREMIALFLEAMPQRLAAARSGLSRGDAHVVEHELHALKSSAAQLGALRMNRLSVEGERLAKAGALDAAPDILDALDAEMPRVREWLESARAREDA
ncbi:MAG TPA: Hpt domain-containing protein [Thermoanaerobaculia bacterium]|jgi:two-component system sensor histidine kinase RpfC